MSQIITDYLFSLCNINEVYTFLQKTQLNQLNYNKQILYFVASLSKENIKEDKHVSKGVRFHENCKIEDGGPMMKQVKNLPQPSVLNTIVCPKLEEL